MNNPINNIVRMHQRVQIKRQQLEEELEQKKQEEYIKKKLATANKKSSNNKQKKVKETSLKESYLNFGFSLLGGLKLEVKKIHFRYEDDYF